MHLRSAFIAFALVGMGLHVRAQFLTTALQNFLPSGSSVSQAMIDVDGDGDIDAVKAHGQGVNAYLNDGLYTYRFPRSLYADPHIELVAFGDLNGDGLADFVCQSGEDEEHNLSVVLQTAPFLFQAIVMDTVVDSPNSDDLFLFDADGDGDLDILWPSSDTPLQLNQGNGSFLPGMPLVGFDGAYAMFGDVDGNGTMDIIDPRHPLEAINWLPGLGGGAFGPAQTLIANAFMPSFTQPAIADLDNDGDLDLLVRMNGELQKCTNDGSGGFTPSVIALSEENNLGETGLLGDFDGDGDVDIGVKDTYSRGWCANDGTGAFGPLQTWEQNGPSDGQAFSLDIDQDGDVDVVGPGLSLFFNNGHGNMTMNMHPGGSGDYPLFPVDMDGDGDIDLATGHLDWMKNEQGSFDAWVGVNDSTQAQAIAVCDVDGDGDADEVLHVGDDIMILENNGAGYFHLGHVNHMPDLYTKFALGDMDQDGYPDVVAAWGSNASWFANDGTGVFSLAGSLVNAAPIRAIAVLDVTGDGLLDVCVSLNTVMVICTGTGGGAFSNQTVPIPASYQAFAAADVDGDGDHDLIAAGSQADLFRGDGLGGFLPAEVVFPSVGSGVKKIELTDADGDGLPDLFYCTTSWYDDPVYAGWSRNDGSTPFATYDTLAFDDNLCSHCGVSAYALLDMEGDGDSDMISFVGNNIGQLRLHRNQTGGPCSISGSVFADLDEDQVQGPGDPGFPHAMVITDAGPSSMVLDPSGGYSMSVAMGDYMVSCAVPEPWWQLTTGTSSYSAQLAAPGAQLSAADFGYAPALDTLSVLSSFVSSPTRCGFTVHQWVNYRNEGTIAPLDGHVRLVVDPLVNVLGSVPPTDSIVGDTLYWGIDALALFEERNIRLDVQMPGVAYLGDTIHALLSVVARNGDDEQITDTPWEAVINCAYDPNDKQVEPVGFGAYGAIDIGTDASTYTIRFQNTGSDTAFTVILTDQLDPLLEAASVTVVGSSHPLTAVVLDPTGTLTFRFEGIHLPSIDTDSLGSQGFVRFRIRIVNGPPDHSVVENTARIYFDLNPAITTNTVSNTLVDCSAYAPTIEQLLDGTLMASSGLTHQWFLDGQPLPGMNTAFCLPQFAGDYTVEVMSVYGCLGVSSALTTGIGERTAHGPLVYPNPASNTVNVEFEHVLSSDARTILLDQLGQVVLTMACGGRSRFTFDLAGVVPGIYVLRTLENGIESSHARVLLH